VSALIIQPVQCRLPLRVISTVDRAGEPVVGLTCERSSEPMTLNGATVERCPRVPA